MSTTRERLATRSSDFLFIAANEILRIQSGLNFRDGTPATPNFVEYESFCPHLATIQKNSDGTFDVWNPTTSQVVFGFRAHHLHSEESEPLPAIQTPSIISPIQPPVEVCQLGGGGDSAPDYLLGDFALAALETVEQARLKPATTTLLDEDPDALQNAILAAVDGDVIEVQTNAIYNPIIIPAATSLVIRAGDGFTPSLTGQGAYKLTNGAKNSIIAGFEFVGCTTPAQNQEGAAVSFLTQGCIVNDCYFDHCTFREVEVGSAVMLSYHWTDGGGDNYANPPQYSELSNNIGFFECDWIRACNDAIEGAQAALRAIRRPIFYKCDFDGEGAAIGSRGASFQNCLEVVIFESDSYHHTTGNGEAWKFDVIGAPVAVPCTGKIIRSTGRDSIEGIDIDDHSQITAIDCLTYGNDTEGISVDDSAKATIYNCKSYQNDIGILVEAGGEADLENNHAFSNTTGNYSSANPIPPSNIDGLIVPVDTDLENKRIGLIPAYLQEHPPAGETFAYNSPVITALPEMGTYYNIKADWQAGLLRDILLDPAAILINEAKLFVNQTGWYSALYSMNIANLGGPNIWSFVSLFINGIIQDKTTFKVFHRDQNEETVSGGGYLYLKAGEPLELRVSNWTTLDSALISWVNFRLNKIQG